MIVGLPVKDDAVQGVRTFAARTRLKLVVHEVQDTCDQWMQDTIQPGLFAFPTELGAVQVRASLTRLQGFPAVGGPARFAGRPVAAPTGGSDNRSGSSA